MNIKFEGYYHIPDNESPDDIGSIDIWLINHIKNIIDSSKEIDEVYDKLNLSWTIIKKENNE